MEFNKTKPAYTLIEVMFSATILSMVVAVGISIMLLINNTLFDGQIEVSNRSTLNDTIYFLTREIQSAEGIRISPDGKSLKIKVRGSADYSLHYEITSHYPVSYLAFKDKRLLDLDYNSSLFEFNGQFVKVTLAVCKNDVELGQTPIEFSIEILPRNDAVLKEVAF